MFSKRRAPLTIRQESPASPTDNISFALPEFNNFFVVRDHDDFE
jgi:hypothetical protein